MAVRRGFGIAADPVAGGSSYDDLVAGAIPDATEFWPVTAGNLDKGIAVLDRNDEVRGRRSPTPSIPFQAVPAVPATVPAYLSIVAKAMAWCMGGGDTVSGGPDPAPFLHRLAMIGYGADTLPKQVMAQLIRDDANHKASGASINRVSLNFPIDGEATMEVEFHPLYYKNDGAAAPTVVYTDLSPRPLVLRDAAAWLDGASEQQTATLTGTPTGGTFTLGLAGLVSGPIAYNATAAAVQAALEGLASIGAGNVSVSGGAGGPWIITFRGTLAGRNIGVLVANGSGLTGGTTPAVAVVETTPGGESIPDLQGFEFTINQNLTAKHYARRNRVSDGDDILWFPEIRKLGGLPEITSRLIFGNVNSAQEVKQDFRKVQRVTFDCDGASLGSTPAASELLRITQFATQITGGGPEGLTARDDITSNFELGAFFSDADAADIRVEVVNRRPTSYLAAGL